MCNLHVGLMVLDEFHATWMSSAFQSTLITYFDPINLSMSVMLEKFICQVLLVTFSTYFLSQLTTTVQLQVYIYIYVNTVHRLWMTKVYSYDHL